MGQVQKQYKKSIRFFNGREVRAVWDDDSNCWWFSATDIVRAINDEAEYVKAGNYWRWLKRKLKQQGIEPVSATHRFKFEAPDGKLRVADVLDSEGVALLAKNYPNNRANGFEFLRNIYMARKKKEEITIHSSAAEHLTFVAATRDSENSKK